MVRDPFGRLRAGRYKQASAEPEALAAMGTVNPLFAEGAGVGATAGGAEALLGVFQVGGADGAVEPAAGEGCRARRRHGGVLRG